MVISTGACFNWHFTQYLPGKGRTLPISGKIPKGLGWHGFRGLATGTQSVADNCQKVSRNSVVFGSRKGAAACRQVNCLV